MHDQNEARVRAGGPGRAELAPTRRRTLVLMMTAFAVPIIAVVALAAFDGNAALNVVIVGVGVVSVLAPWATSGMDDRPHGGGDG